MKKIKYIQREQLVELLSEAYVLDSLDICRVICDYYSKYESPIYVGDPKLFEMIALSNAGRKIYCTLSDNWEIGVPYKEMADISMELDFKVLAFAASWDGFNKVAKRIENLATKCTIKVFAVKSKSEGWDKEIILQLIDWIENDTIPTKWEEDVKCKTIKL